jgi:hypothetical protein
MVEKSQDKEMDKSVAVGNVENNSEKNFPGSPVIYTEIHRPPPEKNFPGSPVTDPPGKEFSWVPGQEFSVVLGHRPPKDFEFSLGHFLLDSTWEWPNPVVWTNREGDFPQEWRSHDWGNKNFPRSHERHILFSPGMA